MEDYDIAVLWVWDDENVGGDGRSMNGVKGGGYES